MMVVSHVTHTQLFQKVKKLVDAPEGDSALRAGVKTFEQDNFLFCSRFFILFTAL